MSLQWSVSREVPPDTAAIGQVVLKAESVYRQIGDHFDALFPQDSEFAFMYDEQGRGAIPPLLVGLVTAFQMLEKVPDRAAAEFVASRIDWKYALHLPLNYPGFHWTDLLAFRNRLREHQQERLLFDQILAKLQGLGLLKARGKMRSDSTQVLAVIERLSQLELVTESIRMALRAVTELAPDGVASLLPASFQETYSRQQSEYGLSQAQVRGRLVQAGQDGFWFLAQLARTAAAQLGALPAVATLRTVLAQQFPQGPSEPPTEQRPTGQGVIESPHEPEARYGTKRGRGWIGYKVQVTETCDADLPHLVVDLEPTGALDNDAPQLPEIQERLQARDLLPAEQQVDQGYMSGEQLVKSADLGINLLGIPLADTQAPADFRQTDFTLDVQTRQAVCPAGHIHQVWSEKQNPQGGPPQILIRFAGATCQACPFFGRCTQSPQGRSLTLHPYRAALLARRAEAQTEAFRAKLHLRAGIEGTISELTRAHGLRKARYRGLLKQGVQDYFTAVAANLKRLARWWAQPAVPSVAGVAS
jgi:transposase